VAHSLARLFSMLSERQIITALRCDNDAALSYVTASELVAGGVEVAL